MTDSYGPVMDGVLTALVVFILVCVVMPDLVKDRTQFYGAFGCVVAAMVLSGLGVMVGGGFRAIAYVGMTLLNIGALLLLFLACGGLTARGLAAEMKGAFEVIRRGETGKETIIPIAGQAKRPPRDVSPAEERGGEDLAADLDAGEFVARKPVPPKKPPVDRDSPIPLEGAEKTDD
jgi:hypothetical protein